MTSTTKVTVFVAFEIFVFFVVEFRLTPNP